LVRSSSGLRMIGMEVSSRHRVLVQEASEIVDEPHPTVCWSNADPISRHPSRAGSSRLGRPGIRQARSAAARKRERARSLIVFRRPSLANLLYQEVRRGATSFLMTDEEFSGCYGS
jgi:hypothetical protein